jgi:hypothetical protein
MENPTILINVSKKKQNRLLETKNDVSYYIRNQNIQEPIVNVVNDQSGQDIVFCFQPTTDVASDHTNQ